MSESRRLIVSPDLNEFFKNELTEAKADLGLKLGDVTEFYLVNLLCEYTRAGEAPHPETSPWHSFISVLERPTSASGAALEGPR